MNTLIVKLLDVGTGNLFELPFTSINFIEELNNGSNATFNFDFASIDEIARKYNTNIKDLFCASFREIWIELNGTKIWYGVVSEYSRSKGVSANYTLQIGAIDYFSLFQKRRTVADYLVKATDPAAIPWALINYSQGLTYGDFGITAGATASTGLSVNLELKYAEIRQSIIDLSNAKILGSFDFDIDYTKKLNIYYPTKGTSRPGIVFDDNNSMGDSIRIPLILSITNSVFVTGSVVNNILNSVNRVSSNPTINAWKRLEDVISDTTLSDTTLLNALGDRHLSLNELPLYQVTRVHNHDDIDITSYGIGDTVKVNIPEEGISYATYRVRKRTIDIDEAGTITSTVDFLII